MTAITSSQIPALDPLEVSSVSDRGLVCCEPHAPHVEGDAETCGGIVAFALVPQLPHIADGI